MAGSLQLAAHSESKRRTAAGIDIPVGPLGDERLMRPGVLVEPDAMMRRMVRLRSVAKLLHARAFRAQKIAFKAPICSNKANPSAAGITVRIVSSSILHTPSLLLSNQSAKPISDFPTTN
jgi:hypothetical protein